MGQQEQMGGLGHEFIELRAAAPRREGPAPDRRPEDALRRFATSLDVAAMGIFATRPRGFAARVGGRRAIDDWELAAWVAEALLRHGLGGHRAASWLDSDRPQG